jgi:hypothetical protein
VAARKNGECKRNVVARHQRSQKHPRRCGNDTYFFAIFSVQNQVFVFQFDLGSCDCFVLLLLVAWLVVITLRKCSISVLNNVIDEHWAILTL